MFFPHRTITRRILVNATIIWLGLRFGAAFMGWGVGTSPALAVWIVMLAVVLGVLDTRRRSRRLLLENLGISWRPILVLGLLPPLFFEICWFLVART